jgi:hypothetical protein
MLNRDKTRCIRGHELAGDNLYVRPNGKRECRACHARQVREARWENPEHTRELLRRSHGTAEFRKKKVEYMKTYAKREYVRVRNAARQKLNDAVAAGTIRRPSRCENCGARGGRSVGKALEAHHADYLRPLFVEWLCRACHAKRASHAHPTADQTASNPPSENS